MLPTKFAQIVDTADARRFDNSYSGAPSDTRLTPMLHRKKETIQPPKAKKNKSSQPKKK